MKGRTDRRRIVDGVYLAILRDGTVAGGKGLTRANAHPKVYTTESAAIARAGLGGRVLFVSDTQVTQVWPKPQTFLNEEMYSLCSCGKAGCYMCGYD